MSEEACLPAEQTSSSDILNDIGKIADLFTLLQSNIQMLKLTKSRQLFLTFFF